MIPTPIPGMRLAGTPRFAQQLPRLQPDGLGSIRLYCVPENPLECAVHITRENRIVLSDPHGSRVFQDVRPQTAPHAWFVFQRGEALEPGIYRMSWMRSDGAFGAIDFEVPDGPFHPTSTFEQAPGTRDGFSVELIYRGHTILPANESSVLLEAPFELNPIYHRPAWAVMSTGNKVVPGVSLEVTHTYPKAWRVTCSPVSAVERRIDWVIY